jgi:hypothetical protein
MTAPEVRPYKQELRAKPYVRQDRANCVAILPGYGATLDAIHLKEACGSPLTLLKGYSRLARCENL